MFTPKIGEDETQVDVGIFFQMGLVETTNYSYKVLAASQRRLGCLGFRNLRGHLYPSSVASVRFVGYLSDPEVPMNFVPEKSSKVTQG